MLKSLKPAKETTTDLPGVSNKLGESLNLRLLIHYVGDIHQPLHAVSRYTEDHKKGDSGGNFFKIEIIDKINELHALWDSVLTEFDNDLTLVRFL
jgi:hypothetical protein